MAIRDQIMEMASSDPTLAQAVDRMEAALGATPIVPEDLDEAISLLEFVLQNPDKYEEVRAAAIEDDLIDPQMIPEQYDSTFIISLLVALYALQDRSAQNMARGGLRYAARKAMTGGQGGDTELVHVNRREKEMLRRMGGQGTVNPNTGLQEYKSLKKVLRVVAPIALNFLAPGLGSAIGGALGLSGAAAGIVGGAIVGGATSALTGGDPLKGALMGGLGGGLGNVVGGAANNALGLGLGQAGQAVLGSGLVGGVAGLATGEGFLKGAGQGVLGGAIGELAGGASGPTAFQQGVSAAGRSFGQGLTSGYDPKTAATMGALTGLATGITYKPSDVAVDNIGKVTEAKLLDGTTTANIPGTQGVNAQGQGGTYVVNPTTGAVEFKVSPGAFEFNANTGAVEWKAAEPGFLQQALAGGPLANVGQTGQATADATADSSGLSLGKIALGAAALSGLAEAPPDVVEAVSTLSPQQQEYFNRPTIAWDWNALQNDATANNMSLSQYMARNWNVISGGRYNMQPVDPTNMNSGMPATPGMMRGGMYAGGGYHRMPDGTIMPNSAHKMNMGGLSQVSRYYGGGGGSGRIDNINAHLSPNEYVMDAETVAMLGDGSPDEGAKQLDMMRKELRMHKGKELSKGKFSPDAKSPLNYLKGVA